MSTELKALLDEIHSRVINTFQFKDDRGEEWRMPPSDYNGSQVIKDDCDGFCLAARALLRKANIPSRLVYCEVEERGHLVVEAEGWILDNRQSIVVSNTLLKVLGYKFIQISGYAPGEPWRLIVNA